MVELEPVIGIEIHVELNTKSKVFSSSENGYGFRPNTKINVIDLGYPGTLPTVNKEVINAGIKIAHILNCQINKLMHFDRKNYFYPDNSKNYQITQSRTPIGYNGYIDINVDNNIKRIGISRVHIEEDTAKSMHLNTKTLLDFNRAGIPLIEIVTKPDISNAKEAMIYIETLRRLLLYIDVSDVKMEEGSMRCDVNISLKPNNSNVLGTKVEVKNIGSISNVGQSINYEIARQKELILNNIIIKEETRRFDEKNNATILMRLKEKGNDYRYFPEPDIPLIELDDNWIKDIINTIPRLPSDRYSNYIKLGINEVVANKLIQNKELCDFFEELLSLEINYITAANILTTDVAGYLNKNNINIRKTRLEANNFGRMIDLLDKNEISSKMAKELLNEIIDKGMNIEELIKFSNKKIINDKDEIISIINTVLNNNKESIVAYKSGKDNVLKHLMGEVMKITKGQINPILANELLLKQLNSFEY